MGRKSPELTSFIREALIEGKYKQHLDWIDIEKEIFRFDLPRVSKYCDFDKLKILGDWYGRKDDITDLKTSKDYSKVKQALQMSIKKSVYFENIRKEEYRFLTKEDIEIKRKKLKSIENGVNSVLVTQDHINTSPCSVASSGYGSLEDDTEELEEELANAPLPEEEDWKSFLDILNSPNETGAECKSVMLYKIEWEQIAGNGIVLSWELSDLCLNFPDPGGNLSSDFGLFVDREDLLTKLRNYKVHISGMGDRLILILEQYSENDVIPVCYKTERKEGNIFVLPNYFIFYSGNFCRK